MKTPALLTLFLLLPAVSPAADTLDRAMSLTAENNRQERTTQKKIDRISEQNHAMLEEYLALGRELDSLSTYNDQLQRLVDSQHREKADIEQQMSDIELTQREIVPLMLRMIDRLDRFVKEDIPFLQAERQQRVARLRELMDRADVAVAEKYRRLLEAYRIELDYSRTLEAYQDEIGNDGRRRTVDMLRVGRVGLYYLSLDGREAAWWDADERRWKPMDSAGLRSTRRALRIARQQAAPELLELPLHAAGPADEE
ncbi:MAG TPA: DUF3450 domain-containing protein [Gammaproteobacteria bacterium]|nr:DUF3450 domain-containing protein [Gammaproteobacteria bacterium]